MRHDITVRGLGSTPLAGYLAALGLLRAVTRLADPAVSGRWERRRFVLTSQRFETTDDLVHGLHTEFRPEAIASPWNAGSGFAGNGKSATAEKALRWVREGTDPRWARMRAAVEAGDRVVRQGRELGWGGTGSAMWAPAHKTDVLRLCRNEFPDDALAWLDAAVALGQDGDPAYSRILGTGGNLGRFDLSAAYIQLARTALEDKRGPQWLRSALTGEPSAPLPKETLGQYDPGAVGNPEDQGALGNPWTFLLLVEGALLFSTAVVRRHGVDYARAALPFQVRGSTAGFDSAAPGETALSELWAPEWSAPSGVDEVAHLLAEGRVEWNSQPARSGLDFARAAATLGVDRGITAFGRHVFLDRHGQSPLAVAAGRIAVRDRGEVRLLAPLDNWLTMLRRVSLPSTVDGRLRALDQAVFAHARSAAPADLVAVFEALGRCHEAVARSSTVRGLVPPLVLSASEGLLRELRHATGDDRELRIALALATARDVNPSASLRPMLSPVTAPDRAHERLKWTFRPMPPAAGILAKLADAARRRARRDTRKLVKDLVPAVCGTRIGFQTGLHVSLADLHAVARGELAEARLADLLAGLVTVTWTTDGHRVLPGEPTIPEPVVDLLLPFTDVTVLRVRGEDGTRPILLRPGSGWPAKLVAGRITDVLDDAARRLRIAGLQVITPTAPPADLSGRGLATLLLLKTTDHDRDRALHRIADLTVKESTA